MVMFAMLLVTIASMSCQHVAFFGAGGSTMVL